MVYLPSQNCKFEVLIHRRKLKFTEENMSNQLKREVSQLGMALLIAASMTACIEDELPNINVDITGVTPASGTQGIVNHTIQENGITIYADGKKADWGAMQFDFEVSPGATCQYVDVVFNKSYATIDYQGQTYTYEVIDTVITSRPTAFTDYSETRYVKVLAEAVGLRSDDVATASKFSKFGGIDPETGRLFKIWSINVLPANIPTQLHFDNWFNPFGLVYQHPYELVQTQSGQDAKVEIWASTNNSLGVLLDAMYKDQLTASHYGASPTDEAVRGKALRLTTRDIGMFDASKPLVSGCLYIGEFDGHDSDPLTCTHVGLPFDKLPKKLSFYYKYLPTVIQQTGVAESAEYAGQLDRGLIRAVLYRADSQVPYLTGKNICNNTLDNVIAYAQFIPEGEVKGYTYHEEAFTFVHDYSKEDLKNFKYNLAIYLASSLNGFTFIGGGDTQLFIDEMEVECE